MTNLSLRWQARTVFYILWKECLISDGQKQQFHLQCISTKWTITSYLKSLNTKKCGGNPGPGSGLAKKCGGIKWLPVIGYQPSLS